MKRIALIAAGIALAGGIAATPAVAGLAGNPSFSHEIPVPVPSKAKQPVFLDDHGGGTRSPATPHAEPTDDHRRGGATAYPASPYPRATDDHGGLTPHAEPSDDHHRGGGGSGRS